MTKYLTLVAVGDRQSKKTELLLRYTGGCKSRRHNEYVVPKYDQVFSVLKPMIWEIFRFQNNVQNIIVDRIPRTVYFMDTESDDDYEILRRDAYEKADCILLCYSIKAKSTFKNVYRKWCLEVRKHTPFVPIVLIGTEAEARGNNSDVVSTEQGENLKLLIGAYAFIECSIENFLGIDDIFIEAVRSTTYPKRKL
ncbi:ras-like GTP-binding protein RhoL [Asbolus verrucosus]|uniref:Ras-like GTP-binding protein RhoL n=1 Tax=Asbolus verrucosus TaxID=1661398 RepID=A0A482VLQ2_ASBVE|nr:ras-like GTP-binding protein RhoL [Asbolus verrucosus]